MKLTEQAQRQLDELTLRQISRETVASDNAVLTRSPQEFQRETLEMSKEVDELKRLFGSPHMLRRA